MRRSRKVFQAHRAIALISVMAKWLAFVLVLLMDKIEEVELSACGRTRGGGM